MSGLIYDDAAESVFDLIPPEAETTRKRALYKSQFPGTLPPSCSTFCLKNTSKPGVANVGGDVLDIDIVGSSHAVKKSHAHLGKLTHRPNPQQFTRRREGEPRLPTPQAHTYSDADRRRPAVPKRNEKPVMGLTSTKNFITANAVENILAVPKKTQQEQPRYVAKPDYGKVPAYLDRVKREINEEYQYVQDMQRAAADANRENVRALTDEERETILGGLREKWNELNRAYQTLKFSSDTPSSYQRKERLEQQMSQIEKDIEKMSKKFVYVHEDF